MTRSYPASLIVALRGIPHAMEASWQIRSDIYRRGQDCRTTFVKNVFFYQKYECNMLG